MTRKIARGSVKQFSIGFVAPTLYESLPELIRRFRLIISDVEVALLEMTTLEQMAALKDGRIDVGFGRLRFDDPAITRIVMRRTDSSGAASRPCRGGASRPAETLARLGSSLQLSPTRAWVDQRR
jgi:DNA-binding transcriptional LysR family regulator